MYHLYAMLAVERIADELAAAERRRLVRTLRRNKVRRTVGQGLVNLGLRVSGVADMTELKRAA